MPAGIYNFKAEQGATLNRVVYWKDSVGAAINLTGYAARMQVRQSKAATTTIASLTTENGGLVISALDGSVTIMASATTTAAWPVVAAFYDLELEKGGVVTRLLEGQFTISAEVTR